MRPSCLALAAFLGSTSSASAAPPPRSSAPCALTLALPDSSNSMVTRTPDIDVNLTNLSPRILYLRWVPPYPIVFQVDFKPASDTPNSGKGWTRLTRIPVPPEFLPDPPATVTISESHVEKSTFLPGEQDRLLSQPTGFALDKKGFYRIRATLTFRKDGRNLISPDTAGRATRLQPLDLVLSAPPLLLRRTERGFSAVPADYSKNHTEKKP